MAIQITNNTTKKQYLIRLLIICALIASTIALIFVIVKTQHKNNNKNNKNICKITSVVSNINYQYLDIQNLLQLWDLSSEWNVCEYIYGKELATLNVTNQNVLKVMYPRNSYNPSGNIFGGIHFYAQPSVFPTREISFNYSVNFDQNFDWVKGGKLPGVYIGQTGANGGTHLDNGSSYRIMWRARGRAEAYIYVPQQLDTYYKLPNLIVNNDGAYGDSVWRGLFNFNTETWNNVSMYIKLNTFTGNNIPNYDGILMLTVNNVTLSFNQMLWASTQDMLINGLMMQSFFGGCCPDWATPFDQNIYFKDFSVGKY
jgi:hypothetical protein